MKLTWEEIKDIANRLDEIVGNHFHEAMYDTIFEREGDEELEVTDDEVGYLAIHIDRLKRLKSKRVTD